MIILKSKGILSGISNAWLNAGLVFTIGKRHLVTIANATIQLIAGIAVSTKIRKLLYYTGMLEEAAIVPSGETTT